MHSRQHARDVHKEMPGEATPSSRDENRLTGKDGGFDGEDL